MKYFDVHTHIFPKKIAAKVVQTLETYYDLKWRGTGEVEDLISSMDLNSVEKAVIFSCATCPEQVTVANDYLSATASLYPGRFVAVGTLHPDFQNTAAELARFKTLGLRGVKIHPDFQKVYIDEPKMLRIYELTGDSMPIIFHMGDSRTDFSSPYRLARVLDLFPQLKVVAAHFGGYSEWDQAQKHLVGRDLWFDTSSTLWKLPVETARSIAREHGTDRLLFASDYPASHHDQAIADVKALGFSEKDNEKIFYKNAEKLFGLSLANEENGA